MRLQKPILFTISLVAVSLGFASYSGSSLAPPAGSPPKNLRVTGVTDWSVGLRWDAPRGRTPDSYVIQSSTGHSMQVPGTQTSATFTNGFSYLRTYKFRAYAVSNGSWSNASNEVTATLLPDTTPPTQPVVSANGTGPTHIDLAWACTDGDPNMRFDIFVNDALRHGQVAGNSKTILVLRPETTYTFKVRARDSGGNWSLMSEPFVITTPPADPSDKEPPTAPPGLWGDIVDSSTFEAMFFFGHSTDNVTSQNFIEYRIYLNGVLQEVLVGTFHNHSFFVYLEPGIVNTVQVFARDEAGNLSAPSSVIFDLSNP